MRDKRCGGEHCSSVKDENIKRYVEDILIIFAFAIIIFTIMASRELNNLDEVWVFNTARNIANGLLPYKEFNIVTTPGLPMICGLILKIFGTEMFFMRIMASLLNAFIIFIIYKILKLLRINKYISIIFSSFILELYTDFLCIDYNVMILFIALLALYIELRIYDKENELLKLCVKRDILLGLLVGTSILMKQTTGICLTVAFIGYKILFVRNKDDFKNFFKIAVIRILAICIPVFILIMYLLINNIMSDFINYAILGIKEFTNKISYIRLIKSEYFLWAFLAPVTFIILLYNGIKNKDKISIIIFAYAISTFIVVYPISDPPHFLIASTIDLIGLIYLLKCIYEKRISNIINEKLKIFIKEFCKNIFFVLIISFALICCIKLWNLNLKQYIDLNNFKYIPVSTGYVEEIKKVGKYIEESEKTVYILEARAPLYMIPINRYNKDYDMFLIGNMGANATEKIINDLNSKDDVNLLLLKGNMNWQTPMDIIEYVKQNYKKNGEIGNFNIYHIEENNE